MRFFKHKVFQRILSLLMLLCLFILLDTGMGELLSPPTYATCFNHDIADAERDGGADILFVGASRVYRTFVPQVFEDVLNVHCVVNAGSSSQPICATYWELKDLVERLHPGRVFIGVTWDQLIKTPDLQSRLIVFDRLSLKNRIQMGINCFKLSEMPYFFASYRFKDNFSLNKMRTNINEKRNLASSGYTVFKKKNEYYADTGFVYGHKSYMQGNISMDLNLSFSEEKIKPENLAWLDACVRLCKECGINVALVTGVTTMERVFAVQFYQEAVDWYTSFAEERQIPYYNLNYLVGREDFLPDGKMHDHNHANGEGAREVSLRFAQILKKKEEGEDVSSCFYKDLDALKKDVHRIVGLRADITTAEEDEYSYKAKILSLQNDDVEPLYRIKAWQEDGRKDTLLQDWTPETDLVFTLPGIGVWNVRVEAASEDFPVGMAFQEYRVGRAESEIEGNDSGEEE